VATANSNQSNKKLVRKVRYAGLHKLFAGVSLLAFVVVIIAGVMADVPFIVITFRACVVMIVIGLASRIVVQVLANYEEMNRG